MATRSLTFVYIGIRFVIGNDAVEIHEGLETTICIRNEDLSEIDEDYIIVVSSIVVAGTGRIFGNPIMISTIDSFF